MARIRFKRNSAGFQALLTSPEARALVSSAAAGLATRAGPGFGTKPGTGRTRARAYVYPATDEARKATEDHALERVIGGLG